MLSAAEIEQLPVDVKQHIAALTHTYESRITEQEREIEDLQERLQLALFRKFGRKSESVSELLQAMLFEELEDQADADSQEEVDLITVPSHTRKKRGRKPLSDDLPRVDVIHDIPEEEKQCGCGHHLSRIDEEISEKLKIIPEQVYVERHIRPKYGCRACEGSGDEDKPVFRIAPVPPAIIPKSIVTPELLAFIIQNKFVDHLPYYRQEKRFERIGARISRQDMANWQQKAYQALKPLKNLLRHQILSGSVIQMAWSQSLRIAARPCIRDETTVQVMNEEGRPNTRKSYMWLARGGPPGKPVIEYAYHETRGSAYAREYLESYSGYLQTDGYVGYEAALKGLEGIVHVGCMAHVRRKFFEATKSGSKSKSAHEALAKIAQFYRIEHDLRDSSLSDEEFVLQRKERILPLAEEVQGLA